MIKLCTQDSTWSLVLCLCILNLNLNFLFSKFISDLEAGHNWSCFNIDNVLCLNQNHLYFLPLSYSPSFHIHHANLLWVTLRHFLNKLIDCFSGSGLKVDEENTEIYLSTSSLIRPSYTIRATIFEKSVSTRKIPQNWTFPY